MGRIDATDEEIEEAVEASGATEIIGKLKYGYDTELQGQGWWGTAVSVDQLMKRAHHMDEWEEKCVFPRCGALSRSALRGPAAHMRFKRGS